MPEVIQDNLAHWVDDNVDALVRAFASDDDVVVVTTDDGDVVDVGEDSDNNGASSLSGSDSGDEASDASN